MTARGRPFDIHEETALQRGRAQMKALVVYESMFGNTEQIARAVAAGTR